MPNPSPEHAALLITRGIFDNLEALTSEKSTPSDEEVATRNAQLQQLTERGSDILTQQGYGQELGEMIGGTDHYFQTLLMRSMTSRFLDKYSPEDTDPLAHQVMRQVADRTASEPLSPPNLDDFVHRIREPYGSLIGAVGITYSLAWKGRYKKARDAGNALLGFNRPNNSPQP